ncbi:TPA: hypothetical protein ACRZ4F_001607 [Vibrio harveyi]
MSKGPEKVKETPAQRRAVQNAGKEWNRYQDVFVKVENEYKRISESMGDKANYEKIAGAANTTANAATSAAVGQTEKRLSATGVNPNSGKSATAVNDIVTDSGNNEIQTAAQGEHNVTQRYTGNLQNVMAMGQGEKTTATAGLNDIARASGVKARQNAINEANEVSIPAAAVGAGASLLAGSETGQNMLKDAKQGLSNYFKPNEYNSMKSPSGFSPMGGASSYGLSDR